MLRFQIRVTILAMNTDLARGNALAVSVKNGYAQTGKAFTKCLACAPGKTAHSGLQGCKINGNFSLGHACSLLGVQKRQRGNGTQQHLGGYAAAVQASAAKMCFFNKGNAFTCLGKNTRSRCSAGATAQYDSIKRLHDAPYLTISALNMC